MLRVIILSPCQPDDSRVLSHDQQRQSMPSHDRLSEKIVSQRHRQSLYTNTCLTASIRYSCIVKKRWSVNEIWCPILKLTSSEGEKKTFPDAERFNIFLDLRIFRTSKIRMKPARNGVCTTQYSI